MAEICVHLAGLTGAAFPPPRGPDVCEECLAEGLQWMALRECRDCAHVGCCDSSAGQHATVHYRDTGHPVVRSVMPGDSWAWCYIDQGSAELP